MECNQRDVTAGLQLASCAYDTNQYKASESGQDEVSQLPTCKVFNHISRTVYIKCGWLKRNFAVFFSIDIYNRHAGEHVWTNLKVLEAITCKYTSLVELEKLTSKLDSTIADFRHTIS